MERCKLLGVDDELIAEGGEMLTIIEMGMMDEVKARQERRLAAQTERRKRRKAKEDARKAAELKESGTGEEQIKLEVAIMKNGTFNGDSKVKETLSFALKQRIAEQSSEPTQELKLAEKVKTALGKMHKLF